MDFFKNEGRRMRGDLDEDEDEFEVEDEDEERRLR